jgi:cyclopropane-fatty-acyl-phospholipid synthase
VGKANSVRFFELVRACLRPKSLYLNESIVKKGTSGIRRNAFVQRYIFPNGRLISLPDQLAHLERAKFRVVSVEMGGRDYARTIGHWIRNLTDNWDACAAIEGEERLRAWYMYLMGSLTRFEEGSIDLARVTAEAI